MMTGILYPCETAEDARRAVHSTLFQSMRFLYWHEIADRLRYVGITAEGIEVALHDLVREGRAETLLTAGRYGRAWRVRL